jgi:hypothetical protein
LFVPYILVIDVELSIFIFRPFWITAVIEYHFISNKGIVVEIEAHIASGYTG